LQVCTSLQTNNHASTPQLSFLQAGCPSCRPTNTVKALKATMFRLCNHNETTSRLALKLQLQQKAAVGNEVRDGA